LNWKGKELPKKGNPRKMREGFGLPAEDLRALRALKTPAQIQKFIDGLTYQYADTAGSPHRVLRERKGHCLEGALLAAAALRVNGREPLLMDLEAVHDDDHVIAIYREGSLWGGIAKSNFAGLRFRAPVYRTLRELALSYFESYYNLRGERTLRSYSVPTRTWEGGGEQAFWGQHIVFRASYFHNQFNRAIEGVGAGLVPTLLPNLTPAQQSQLQGILNSENAYSLDLNSLAFRAQGIEATVESHLDRHSAKGISPAVCSPCNPIASLRAGQRQHGDVVVLAKGLRGLRYSFRRLVAQRCGAFKAIERAGLVAGLDYAIGEQGELLVLSQLEDGFNVTCFRSQTQRQAVVQREFYAVEIGRAMAGVGHGQLAIRIGAQHKTRGETAAAARHHPLIHRRQNLAGVLRVVSQRAHRAHQQRNGHGGGHPLAANITDHHQHSAAVQWQYLKEISAYLTSRPVNAVNCEAGNGGSLRRNQHLLHGPRGFQFRRSLGALAGNADGAQH
jgi:hypothetical protein